MKNKLVRCAGALALSAMLVLPLSACGDTEASGDTVRKEWVYVPEFITVEGENVSYYNMQLSGNDAYYSSWAWDEETGQGQSNLCRYSITDKQTETISLAWPDEGVSANINEFVIGADGAIYIVTYDSIPVSEGVYDSRQVLYKFDSQGTMVYSENLTEQFKKELDSDNIYLRTMTVDGQGRCYICLEDFVMLYNEQGAYQGKIALADMSNGWVSGMGRGKDGKVYINILGTGSDGGNGSTLTELDFDGKKLGASYEGFSGGGNSSLGPGIEKDFLIFDSSKVYEYDLQTQTKEELFDWLDSDIDGSSVSACGTLEDGRLAVVYQDWETNDSGIALLTKKKSSEVEQKEIILIGSIYGDSELRSSAVKFNKSSDKYHISIREYMPDEYDDYNNALNDALTNLNNDITSKNGPDIIELYGVNVSQLAAKGVFEDLAPYLEKSTVLNRSDLVEKALEAYTYEGVLVSIPNNFSIMTVAGSAKDLEGKKGWTVNDLIAYADANPGKALFDGVTKGQFMQYLMMYNESEFVDWTTGECKFDSEEFKSMLTFVNRFPDAYDWRSDEASTPTKIQNGEVLLDTVGLTGFNDIQIPIEEFEGQMTCIGFPTISGEGGHAIMTNQAYGITAKSGNKEGAWAFIESVLTQEDSGRYWNGFPVVKSKLDAMIAEATKVEYYVDENGNQVAIMGGGSIGYQDGWSYEYHTTTQEEVDIIMELLENSRPINYNYGSQIVSIINEEADAFYKGQKSVDEVASVIQSRIKIYVGENN